MFVCMYSSVKYEFLPKNMTQLKCRDFIKNTTNSSNLNKVITMNTEKQHYVIFRRGFLRNVFSACSFFKYNSVAHFN